jgi:hypothetical protein
MSQHCYNILQASSPNEVGDEATSDEFGRQTPAVEEHTSIGAPGLKKVTPYWHPYRTYAKQRWWNREILELVSTEFRDRSLEYYVGDPHRLECELLSTYRAARGMRLNRASRPLMGKLHCRAR